MQLAASKFRGMDSLAAQRWSIHDDLIEDLDAETYKGDGIVFQISSGFRKNVPLNNIAINHITVETRGIVKNLIIVGVAPENPLLPFKISFSDNIVPGGRYSVWSTGVGTCPKSGQPATTFKNCWSSFHVVNNVIIDYPSNQGPWPAGNFIVKDMGAARSSYDKNLGADIHAVRAAIEGVR
jgi:hypothetical protein